MIFGPKHIDSGICIRGGRKIRKKEGEKQEKKEGEKKKPSKKIRTRERFFSRTGQVSHGLSFLLTFLPFLVFSSVSRMILLTRRVNEEQA